MDNLQVFAEATGDNIYDREDGEWIFDIEKTEKSIDDFKDEFKSWLEQDSTQSGNLEGMSWVSFLGRKQGDHVRILFTAIDMGDHRLIIRGCALSDYVIDKYID